LTYKFGVVQMDAALREFKQKFPEEKVNSVSKARVVPSSGGGERRLRLSSGASIIVSKKFVAFIFDTKMHYVIMGLLAVLSLLVAVFLLLSGQNWIFVFAVILLGLVVVTLAEALLYMEVNRLRMIVFDKASSEITFDKTKRQAPRFRCTVGKRVA